MLKHINKYWLLYVIGCILLGGTAKLYSNQYTLCPKQIMTFANGAPVVQTYFFAEWQYPLLDVASSILIATAISMIISIVFIRALEKYEKEKFEDKLLEFQKQTSQNAILSTFEKLVDTEFMERFRDDVLRTPFLRRDLRWQYDIIKDEEDKFIILTRTVNYHLHNQTKSLQKERLFMSYFESVHATSKPVSMKFRLNNEKDFRSIVLSKTQESGVTISEKNEVEVPPERCAEIVTVIEQTFPRNYIYETHFLNQSSVNLELTVNMPSDYTFSLNASSLASRTQLVIDEPTKKVYRITGGIYQGQGIEFMCFPSK